MITAWLKIFGGKKFGELVPKTSSAEKIGQLSIFTKEIKVKQKVGAWITFLHICVNICDRVWENQSYPHIN